MGATTTIGAATRPSSPPLVPTARDPVDAQDTGAVMLSWGRAPDSFWQPRRLRAGLAQLLFAVVGLALGLLLPQITAWRNVESHQVTNTLIGVGFAVLGLVTLIFSLLFGVVQSPDQDAQR